MKIIKHGKYYNINQKIECMCGCTFEIEPEDSKIDESVCLTTYPPQCNIYVNCPECNSKIKLGTKFICN